MGPFRNFIENKFGRIKLISYICIIKLKTYDN